jgi:NADH dehydrogenase
VLRHQQNVQVTLAEARTIDPLARRVVIDAEPAISYDYLVAATGATHSYFGHPEWARRAPGLKTLDDALEIRRRVPLAFEAAERDTDAEAQTRLLTFVIIGGGSTGARSLARLGVEVRTGSIVTNMDDRGVQIGGERIDAQTVLWAAGVAASLLARSLGVPLDRAGRVLAGPDLRVPDHPEIFVVGDVCALEQDGKLLPGVVQVAKQEGAHAMRNIARAICGEALLPFRYRDFGNMATIGRGSAVADFGWVTASGLFAWFIWIFVHIFWLIGFRSRFVVFGEWAWAYVTFQRRVRLITGDRLS